MVSRIFHIKQICTQVPKYPYPGPYPGPIVKFNDIMIKTNVTVKSYNRRFFILFVNFYILCGLIEECQKQMTKEHTHCVAQYTKFSCWFSIQSFYNFF